MLSYFKHKFDKYFVFKISLNDLHSVSKLLVEALKIRERYMNMSHQSFPTITSKFLHKNSASTQEDPSISTSGNDINGTTTVGEDQIDLTEIRQNNSCTRITKHEDRQPIAGKAICKCVNT